MTPDLQRALVDFVTEVAGMILAPGDHDDKREKRDRARALLARVRQEMRAARAVRP